MVKCGTMALSSVEFGRFIVVFERVKCVAERYGLSKEDFYNILDLFKKYSDIVAKVIIFGSRARGDYKKNSDIDMAIVFKKDNYKIYEIIEELETKNIIYTFDIIDFDKISNEKLRSYIINEGKVIFLSNEKGEMLVTLNKVMDKLENFKNAYNKLTESLNRDFLEDDIVIDAAIKRFEFTYELSWKLMKSYLEYTGSFESTNPRNTIKTAFKEGLILDGDIWLKMIVDRNKTAHTYDEKNALEVLKNTKDIYVPLFKNLISKIEDELRDQGDSPLGHDSII